MDIEFQKPEEIKAFQEALLKDALRYLQEHSRYYQRLFDRYHIDIEKINHIEDLQKIVREASKSKEPVLYIQGIYPTGKKGYFAVPLEDE